MILASNLELENGAAILTFDFLLANWSVEPSTVATVTIPLSGNVYSYTLNSTTRYRFVPSVYLPTEDAFYSAFDGGVLSGFIVSRG